MHKQFAPTRVHHTEADFSEGIQRLKGRRRRRDLPCRFGFGPEASFSLAAVGVTISQGAADLIDALALSHSMPLADALIGATALEHSLTLLTANTKHFGAVEGLQVEAFTP
jgi:hypothetical protein